jgi:hypothetical protein
MPHHPDRSADYRRRVDNVRGAFDRHSHRSLAGYDRLPLTDVEDHERPQVSHNRISRLRDFGFAEPVKMMTSRPAVPGLSIDNISFVDLIKMITSRPPILSYAIDNIRGKIAARQRQLGFANPVRMITSHPVILRYAIENIRGKIVDLRELGNIRGKIADLRKLGFADPVKMFTPPNPAILGHAQERLLLCCG